MLFFQMLPIEEDNPWNVESLYDLQFFNCPSPFCIYKNSSKQEFVNHAFYFHPESEQYLRNLKDYSLIDVDIPLEETKVDSNNQQLGSTTTNESDIIKTESDDTKLSNKKSAELLVPVELLDQVKKENSYCNQCDVQFCNEYSLENHLSSIHPYLEVHQDNVEEIDVFDELFEADYEKILSKTQNSFGEIIDNVEIDNTDKFRKISQNYDFWEPDNQIQGKENENSVNIGKRKEKKLGEEFETFMNFDDEIFENQSKIQIKDDDQPYKPDEEDENSMNHEMVETKSNTSSSQITGLRNDRKRLIGYKELCKFKEELKNNFDVKIPPPDFTLEDFKNFVFPKPLEELEVIPSILAEYKYVIPSPGNPQCGVCGVFGLNTYPNIKYHHVKHHAIHYACPIDDCG